MSHSKMNAQILQIYNCAVNAVKGMNVIRNRISIVENNLFVSDFNESSYVYDLKNTRVYVIGAGKAVFGLCQAFLSVVDDYNKKSHNSRNIIKIESGILSVPFGLKLEESNFLNKYNIQVEFAAKNNLPDENSVKATSSIIQLLEKIKCEAKTGAHSLIISFISGGGSALLSLPKQNISIQEKREFISQLAKSGCDINELNKVRRCLSLVKGGKLAKIALKNSENVQMLNLIASDVIGDSMSAIASGPTFIDFSENPSSDALQVICKYKVNVPDKIKHLIESEQKMDEQMPSLRNVLLVNNSIAVREAQKTASSLGYKVVDMGTNIIGEASQVGKIWAEIAKSEELKNYSQVAWVGGGETTVTISCNSSGVGGRCQEMALSFFNEMLENKNVSFLAAGTDGQDGPTPVAGCVVSGIVNNWKPEAQKALLEHNSYSFWKKYFPASLVNTNGPTGVNVMDIYCMLKIK
ncbi:glycerate kinase-like protein [Leptotrombidium deliense]|uniref:Glycerate kinase-like protein n=1 Tax=Leptotrombidium deliense TaxID=299467 RepID=A0A443S8P2_9ACAR|nr:glycerate kinase-like protein [Leptotrombidium deliense]